MNGTMIIGLDGRIVAVGDAVKLDADYKDAIFENDIDATGTGFIGIT